MNAPHHPFVPPRGMTNAHLQTVLSSMGRKLWPAQQHLAFHQAAQREIVEVDGVKLALDLNLHAGRPLIMIIPGWLGHSQSSYALASGHALFDAGFCVARFNLRDHGDTTHLNPGMFNSALIDEVVALAADTSSRYGAGPSGLLGFSLGGNFALRVARALPELETLAVCPAITPADTMYSIDRNPIYQRYFVRKWRKLWLEKQQAFPRLYEFGDSLRLTTVSALTDYFVKYHSDFGSTDEYFAAYDLANDALAGVRAHILAAQDDPIIPHGQYLSLPDSLTVHITSKGGHHAYLESWGLNSWFDRYAITHFQQRLS